MGVKKWSKPAFAGLSHGWREHGEHLTKAPAGWRHEALLLRLETRQLSETAAFRAKMLGL
jgi:hypothetical protein